MADKKQFLKIAVEPLTKKQVSILASVSGDYDYETVKAWAEKAWADAKNKGLVTDAMLGADKPQSPTKKKKVRQ